jgi:filamentous hemagglutinin family protein
LTQSIRARLRSRPQGWRRLLVALGLVACIAPRSVGAQGVTTQIVSKSANPIPTTPIGTGTRYEIGEDQGNRPGNGGLLTQEFSLFHLGTGDEAFFTADQPTSTLFAVVDATEPSQIWGTISSDLVGVDFFFLNPAGVVFGETAAINVPGSFHVGSADTLLMETPAGARLSALSGDPALAFATPAAFGFSSQAPAEIRVEGSQLDAQIGHGLSFVGGDVVITTNAAGDQVARIQVDDGRLAIASIGGSGEVEIAGIDRGLTLQRPLVADGGVISVDRSELSVAGPGAIHLQADSIELFQAQPVGPPLPAVISAERDATGAAQGEIRLETRVLALDGARVFAEGDLLPRPVGDTDVFIGADQLSMNGGAVIETIAQNGRTAGGVDIRPLGTGGSTPSFVELDGQSLIRADSTSGIAGDVRISGYSELRSVNRSEIRSDATGLESRNGDVTIQADQVMLSGRAEISSGSFNGANFDGANLLDGGDVVIEATRVSLESGGSIESISVGDPFANRTGNGGDIRIEADSIVIDGAFIDPPTMNPENLSQPSGISSTVGFSPGALGGDISITAETIELTDGGRIAAESVAEGTGGNISIVADRIDVQGVNEELAEVLSQIDLPASGGGLGSIFLQISREEDFARSAIAANSLVPFDIFSGTSFGVGGDAGTIAVDAGEVQLSDGGNLSAFTQGVGGGGSIDVVADRILVFDGGEVSTDTTFQIDPLNPGLSGGDAGTVRLEGDEIELRGASSISSSVGTDGTGDGGRIDLVGGTITLRGDQTGAPSVESSTDGEGSGGGIGVDARTLVLENGGRLSAESTGTGDAGSISVGASETVELIGSSISTRADTALGGNVDISSDGIVSTYRSSITTDVGAGAGNGGNVTLAARAIALNRSTVRASATAGNGGDITLAATEALVLAAPTVVAPPFPPDPQGGVILDASSQLAQSGDILFTSPETNVESGLSALETAYLDASKLIRPSCDVAGGADAGRFVVRTRPGTPPSPEDFLLAAGEGEVDRASQVASLDGVGYSANGADVATRGVRAVRAQQSGDYAAAVEAWSALLEEAERTNDSRRTVEALEGLGNAYLAVGEREAAGALLSRSVVIAEDIGDPQLSASVVNSLGNAQSIAADDSAAVESYDQAARLSESAGDATGAARARANAARAALRAGDPTSAVRLARKALSASSVIEEADQRSAVLIHVGRTFRSLLEEERDAELLLEAQQAFASAIETATTSGARVEAAYAWLNQAELYADEGHAEEALFLGRSTLAAAEPAGVAEVEYRAHALVGDALWAQGRREAALEAYRRAISVIEETRQDSRSRYGSAEENFRLRVAPVYYRFVDALLRSSETKRSEASEYQARLKEARRTVEQLKVAELRDYFRNECVAELEAQETDLDGISQTAAIVYPILLEDRIETLVSIAGQLHRRTTFVEAGSVRRASTRLRTALLSPGSGSVYLEPASDLYEWILRPIEGYLTEAGVETLVFVPGGALRSIPMAVLHDGERHLLERFEIAVTPSLDLVDPAPLSRSGLRLLAAGVSESVAGAAPLPAVPAEIELVEQTFGGTTMLDAEFTIDAFQQAIQTQRPTVVHIASHGYFTGDPATSYLLAHDEPMTMERLSELIGITRFRSDPVELLVLSACQTAAGDDRSTLGLAGVAIRAGARSAIGSLWNISDEAALRLVTKLYEGLADPGRSRAAALRDAQLELLEDPRFQHPFFWSPFLLISDWL